MSEIQNAERIQQIEFIDERERLYFAKAQLGEQIREFLASPTGRYMHGRAKEDLEEARDAALDINPWSPFTRRKLARVRLQAEIARNFIKWATDAIMEAESAYAQLEEYRQ